MDERTAELGDSAAANPPTWALDHLGAVPHDPLERQAWSSRASTVAAYREHYGRTDPLDPIGRKPAAPEARADWHAARAALGIAAQQTAVAGASTGELQARRARYERELAWAPPHVGEDLRHAALARREHATEATLTRAQALAADGPERNLLTARARAHEQLAESLAVREQALSGINTQRARWHEATAQVRTDAEQTSAELCRRGLDAGQPPERDTAPVRERLEPAPARRAHGQAQRSAADADLRDAAETAELARRTLDARRAQHGAQREQQRQLDEPAPERWPHRDPGYQFEIMQRRQAERTAAELAAQDFPAGPEHAARAEVTPVHYEPSPRRSRQAERDEPEASP